MMLMLWMLKPKHWPPVVLQMYLMLSQSTACLAISSIVLELVMFPPCVLIGYCRCI